MAPRISPQSRKISTSNLDQPHGTNNWESFFSGSAWQYDASTDAVMAMIHAKSRLDASIAKRFVTLDRVRPGKEMLTRVIAMLSLRYRRCPPSQGSFPSRPRPRSSGWRVKGSLHWKKPTNEATAAAAFAHP
jgi:hypothetical protein